MQYLDVNRSGEEVMCKASDLKKGGKSYLLHQKQYDYGTQKEKNFMQVFQIFGRLTMPLTADDRKKKKEKKEKILIIF